MRKAKCKLFRFKKIKLLPLLPLLKGNDMARSFLNLISHTWFLSIIQNEFRTGKIDLDSTMKLLEKLQMPFDFTHVKHVFKVKNMWIKQLNVFRSPVTCLIFADFLKLMF